MISHISLIQLMFRKLWHSSVISKTNCAVFNRKRTERMVSKRKGWNCLTLFEKWPNML